MNPVTHPSRPSLFALPEEVEQDILSQEAFERTELAGRIKPRLFALL